GPAPHADAGLAGRAGLPGDDGRLRRLEEGPGGAQGRDAQELPEAEPPVHGGRGQGPAGRVRQGGRRGPGGGGGQRGGDQEARRAPAVPALAPPGRGVIISHGIPPEWRAVMNIAPFAQPTPWTVADLADRLGLPMPLSRIRFTP